MFRLAIALIALVVPSASFGQANDWLLTPSRAGKVIIGMTVEELYTAYGRSNVRLVDLYGEGMFYPALQVYAEFEQGAPILVARIGDICHRQRVIGIDIHSVRFRTADGLGVGATVGEVRKLYPSARLNREAGPSLIVESLHMTFAVADGTFADSVRVVKIWTWRQPSDSVRRCESH